MTTPNWLSAFACKAVKRVLVLTVFVLLVVFGIKYFLHHYLLRAVEQRWDDAVQFTQLLGKKSGNPALDALVARHMAGDTVATQTLMTKALTEGQLTQRMTLFWEAVERAPDPQLYDLLAKHQKWFQEPDPLALMEPSAKKAFLTALGTVKAAALPTIAPAVRISLSGCYARFESRYEGTFGGLLRAYDGYRSKRSCEISPHAAPQPKAAIEGKE